MKSKTAILAIALGLMSTSVPQPSFAQKGSRGGGQTTPVDGKPVLRDLLPSAHCKTYQPFAEVKARAPKLDEILSAIGQVNWYFPIVYRQKTAELSFCFLDASLNNVPSEEMGDIVADSKYTYDQTAIRDGNQIFVNQNIFNEMDDLERSYLIFHEGMHALIPDEGARQFKLMDFVGYVRDLQLNGSTLTEFTNHAKNDGVQDFDRDLSVLDPIRTDLLTILDPATPKLDREIISWVLWNKYDSSPYDGRDKLSTLLSNTLSYPDYRKIEDAGDAFEQTFKWAFHTISQDDIEQEVAALKRLGVKPIGLSSSFLIASIQSCDPIAIQFAFSDPSVPYPKLESYRQTDDDKTLNPILFAVKSECEFAIQWLSKNDSRLTQANYDHALNEAISSVYSVTPKLLQALLDTGKVKLDPAVSQKLLGDLVWFSMDLDNGLPTIKFLLNSGVKPDEQCKKNLKRNKSSKNYETVKQLFKQAEK